MNRLCLNSDLILICFSNISVWEDDDVTAQCLIFFFAGFETASTLLCFLGHELAINPDVQEKLVEEVDTYKDQLQGKPMNYETIHKMTYLDMVITGENIQYCCCDKEDRSEHAKLIDFQKHSENGHPLETWTECVRSPTT